MKKFVITFLMLLLTSVMLQAQTVYFARSYTSDGEPIGAKNSWKIKPGGSRISVLYEQADPIQEEKLYLFIDKKQEGDYEPFNSKTIDLQREKNWVVYDYAFEEPGQYQLTFVKTDGSKLASGKVTIDYDENYTNPGSAMARNYFDYAKAYFCEFVLNGSPVNPTRSVSMSNEKKPFLYINAGKALNTGVINVEVWKRDRSVNDYDKFVASKKYSVQPDWEDTYFQYDFTEPGRYKFSVYNENMILIAEAFVTVNP